jgi:hypothetical protein
VGGNGSGHFPVKKKKNLNKINLSPLEEKEKPKGTKDAHPKNKALIFYL